MLRRLARECAVVAFFLAIAVAMTWPLAKRMDTTVADPGDPLVNAWILDWVSYALTHQPLALFDSPLYQPARLTLAFSENLVGVVLFVLPFHLAGAAPVTVYNLALLLGFAFSAYGTFVLGRTITGSLWGSLVAGLIGAFVPFKFDHLSHMQLLWSGWIPLLLAAVIAYWRLATLRTASLVAVAFAMNGLTNVHYFLFGSFAAVVTVAVLAVLEPRTERRFWLRLLSALAAGAIVLLPFLLPYRIVSKRYGMSRTAADAMSGSAPLEAWLAATPRSRLYGGLGPDAIHRHEMQLFPGLAAILLGIAGAVKSRRRTEPIPEAEPGPPHGAALMDAGLVLLGILSYVGATTERTEVAIGGLRLFSFDSADVPATLFVILLVARLRHRLRLAVLRSRFPPAAWAAAVWIVIGVLGSFGMKTFFHAFLFKRTGVFEAVRAPVRWAVVAYVGLAIWAAIGTAVLVEARRRRATWGVALVALVAFDLWPRIRWEHVRPEVPPVARWLAEERIEPLIEIPASGDGIEFRHLFGSAEHRLRQFNGIESVGHPAFRRIREKLDRGHYDDELLDLLESHGCRLVVVHAHALREGREWLRHNLRRGRLAFLRSFDHEIGGDFVFAVPKNVAGWERLRAAEAPDGAGHLPSQRLERMLSGLPVHSDAIMVRLESPAPGQRVGGPLQVRGWALSPHGLRRASVLFENGAVRVDARLVDRPDVKRLYPWTYFVPRPGFAAEIPHRPAGVRRATNVEIEIEDDAGRTTRSPGYALDWD